MLRVGFGGSVDIGFGVDRTSGRGSGFNSGFGFCRGGFDFGFGGGWI